MVRPAVDYHQGISVLFKVDVDGLRDRLPTRGEIDVYDTAGCRRRLIQQAGGLAEIAVLRHLTDLCQLHGRKTGAGQVILNGAQQDLKRRRRRQAAPRQNVGTDTGVKARRLDPLFGEACRHAADQCRCALLFPFLGIQLLQIHLAHRIAFRQQADSGLRDRPHCGDRLQIDGCGQDHPALVIRVVAAKLGPAGGGKQKCRCSTEHLGKAFFQSFIHDVDVSCI